MAVLGSLYMLLATDPDALKRKKAPKHPSHIMPHHHHCDCYLQDTSTVLSAVSSHSSLTPPPPVRQRNSVSPLYSRRNHNRTRSRPNRNEPSSNTKTRTHLPIQTLLHNYRRRRRQPPQSSHGVDESRQLPRQRRRRPLRRLRIQARPRPRLPRDPRRGAAQPNSEPDPRAVQSAARRARQCVAIALICARTRGLAVSTAAWRRGLASKAVVLRCRERRRREGRSLIGLCRFDIPNPLLQAGSGPGSTRPRRDTLEVPSDHRGHVRSSLSVSGRGIGTGRRGRESPTIVVSSDGDGDGDADDDNGAEMSSAAQKPSWPSEPPPTSSLQHPAP